MKLKRILLTFLLWTTSLVQASSFIYLNDIWESYTKGFDYFGMRRDLGEQGIHFLTSFIFDYNWPTRGGLQTRSFPLNQYLLDLQLGFETEPLLKFKGGRAFICFQYHQSQHPSLEYVGDWQGFDNLNGPNLTQMGELWFEQTFFKNKAQLKFGKIDASSDFSFTNYAQILLNNSFSQNPTILGFPSYPNQAVGIIAKYFLAKWLTLKSSIFDGSNALGIRTGAMGSKSFFNRLGEHALILSEADLQWNTIGDGYTGGLGLGVWGLTARLPNFTKGNVQGTCGAYAFLWQTLYKDSVLGMHRTQDTQRELGGFLQWGSCSKQVFPINTYLGTGLTYKNLTAYLVDSISIGMATTFFPRPRGSPFTRGYETALEATYQFYLFKFILIQPDFQYIINPGAMGSKNAIVATIRFMTSI